MQDRKVAYIASSVDLTTMFQAWGGLSRAVRHGFLWHGASLGCRRSNRSGRIFAELQSMQPAVPPRRPISRFQEATESLIAERTKSFQELPDVSEGNLVQRIISYNVLSSSLSQSTRFTQCTPEDLESTARLQRLQTKLTPEVSRGTVICLQEISMAWSGPLSDFFTKHGYRFSMGLSGNFQNGYLGVGIAYPSERYELVKEYVKKLGVNMRTDSEVRESEQGEESVQNMTTMHMWRTKTGNRKTGRSMVLDEWKFARTRTNVFMLLKLKCKETGKKVCFSNYHMPCAYFAPKVMVIHAALAVQTAQNIADGCPLLLVGDFNMKRGDPAYELVTTGALENNRAAIPDLQSVGDWTPNLSEPLRSAYVSVTGSEPDFTNFAHTSTDGLFVDCLDYIFVSKNVQVLNVDDLPDRTEVRAT